MKKFVLFVGLIFCSFMTFAERLTWKLPENDLQDSSHNRSVMLKVSKSVKKNVLFQYESEYFSILEYFFSDIFEYNFKNEYNSDENAIKRSILSGEFPIAKQKLYHVAGPYKKIIVDGRVIGNYTFAEYFENSSAMPFGAFDAVMLVDDKYYLFHYVFGLSVNDFGEKLTEYMEHRPESYDQGYYWNSLESAKDFANKIQAKDESLPAEILKYIEDWEGIIGSLEIVK